MVPKLSIWLEEFTSLSYGMNNNIIGAITNIYMQIIIIYWISKKMNANNSDKLMVYSKMVCRKNFTFLENEIGMEKRDTC